MLTLLHPGEPTGWPIHRLAWGLECCSRLASPASLPTTCGHGAQPHGSHDQHMAQHPPAGALAQAGCRSKGDASSGKVKLRARCMAAFLDCRCLLLPDGSMSCSSSKSTAFPAYIDPEMHLVSSKRQPMHVAHMPCKLVAPPLQVASQLTSPLLLPESPTLIDKKSRPAYPRRAGTQHAPLSKVWQQQEHSRPWSALPG